MQSADLKLRTKNFALRIMKMVRALPRNQEAFVIGKQILRSGTAVGANYRAVCRARSNPEFVAKIGIVLEEADETAFWLELIEESGLVGARQLAGLKKEADELVRIFAASRITAEKSVRRSNLKSEI